MNLHRAAVLTGCLLALPTSLHAQPLRDIPNSIKYRDSGIPNAKGRSGSAAIEARALLGKDGATELTVTTGSLDDATVAASGNIDKVQLKLPAADAVRNYNNLSSGGLFTETLAGLGRHQPLQVQANVGGIDGHRTDVVTATETVKLRPDLAVDKLFVQPHAAVGVPLRVNALLRERNGDAGARASCVLRAGGVEVDRANGIWVDANGTVSCHLVHTFEDAGVQQLEVALADVAPGDYDLANNSATASIHVYASLSEIPQWWSSAQDVTWQQSTTVHSYYEDVQQHDEGWSKTVSFSANVAGFTGHSSAVHVSFQEDDDGRNVVDIADAPWSETHQICTMATVGDTTVEKCLITPGRRGPTEPVLQVHVDRGGGEVTYHSRGWYDQYNYDTGGYDHYSMNYDLTTTFGEPVEVGNNIALTVRFSDGNQMWEARPFLALQPDDYTYEQPYNCIADWTGRDVCSSWYYHSTARQAVDAHNM